MLKTASLKIWKFSFSVHFSKMSSRRQAKLITIYRIPGFPFLAGLQSNSGLWIDDVRLSVRPSVRPSVRLSTFGKPLRLSLFSVTLISTDSIPCMGIDLDEFSLSVTFPCDPDLDFFCSRSLNNFG